METSVSKNVAKNGTLVKYKATIRNRHERATTCASLVLGSSMAHHHEVTC